MSTGTESTARTAADNAKLADTLISLAGLMRTHPQLPQVYSLHIGTIDYRREGWSVRLYPGAVGEQDEIDAVRTFAGIFPGSELHLSDPVTDAEGGTYRRLEAHASHGTDRLSMWALIAHTPAPAEAEECADEQH